MDQPKLGLVKEVDPPDKPDTNKNDDVADIGWIIDSKDLDGVDVEEVEEEEEEGNEDDGNVKMESEADGRVQETCGDDDDDDYEESVASEDDEEKEGYTKAFGN